MKQTFKITGKHNFYIKGIRHGKLGGRGVSEIRSKIDFIAGPLFLFRVYNTDQLKNSKISEKASLTLCAKIRNYQLLTANYIFQKFG